MAKAKLLTCKGFKIYLQVVAREEKKNLYTIHIFHIWWLLKMSFNNSWEDKGNDWSVQQWTRIQCTKAAEWAALNAKAIMRWPSWGEHLPQCSIGTYSFFFFSFLGVKPAICSFQFYLILYTCVTVLMPWTHQVFYPRLTPNRLRVPQLCIVCNHWRLSTQFHSPEATKHLPLVLHLHQNIQIIVLYVTTGFKGKRSFLHKENI